MLFINRVKAYRKYIKGQWTGIGNASCTDPKGLFESIVVNAGDLIKYIEFQFFDNKRTLRFSPFSSNGIWKITDIEDYGRCFTAKPTNEMISNRIWKTRVKVFANAKVIVQDTTTFQSSRRTMMFVAKKGITVAVDTAHQIFEMLDFGGEPCINDQNYSKDTCTHQLLEQKSLEIFGFTTPFGPNKDHICQNKSNSLKALDLYDNTIKEYSNNCSMPCSFVSTRVVTMREFVRTTNTTGILVLDWEPVVQVTRGHYLYSELSLVAEIGGYVGLFLGVSINQITKIIDVILSQIQMSYKKRTFI